MSDVSSPNGPKQRLAPGELFTRVTAAVSILIALGSLSVAIIALQQAGQRDKRSFDLGIRADLDGNCPKIDTVTIIVVNQGERPITITNITLATRDNKATIVPSEVREVRSHTGVRLAPAPSPLPVTLGDGAIVEITYSLENLLTSPKDSWPRYAEARDADSEERSLYIWSYLSGFVHNIKLMAAMHLHKTCHGLAFPHGGSASYAYE
jgi:hypothetical protein